MKKYFLALSIFLLLTSGFIYSQPVITFPTDTCICPNNVHFNWHKSPAALSYRIQIWQGTYVILDVGGITDSFYVAPDSIFANNTSYYFRMNMTFPTGTSVWTMMYPLCLLQIPNPPILLYPPNGSMNTPINPTFTWNAVPGALGYILQVSKHSSFDTLIVNDTFPLAPITLQYNTVYYWRVRALGSGCPGNWSAVYHFNTQSAISIINISSEIPSEYKLYQNYPNPFNPVTNIKYQITNNKYTTVKIFDVLGKEIVTLVNEKQSPGTYEVTFNGSNLPSGLYYYTIRSGDFSDTKRMVLIK